MSVVIHDGEGDFDEEAVEREEFLVEEIVREFVDEPSIHHDIYPESDEEREGGAPGRQRVHIRRGDGRLYKDQTFFNGVAFKESVVDYVLRTGRNLKQYRYDKDKIGFKCVGADKDNKDSFCQWQIYASTLPNDPMWRVRVFTEKHSCIPNAQCEMFKVPVIARLFVDKIREEPDYYMPMKIEELVMERWKICVSRPQCQAARNKCLRWIQSEYEQQFARLHDYAAELVVSNGEGTTVVVDTVTDDDGKDVFNRFYVCFDVIKRAWKESCRRLIGLDGCFIKARIKGQVLVALGRDGDNRIYPIAWGVVSVENTDNWQWFVKMLKKDLDLLDGDGYIMVSDRQKGLIKAVQLELPKIEHRNCVRHIYGNLKKKHGKKKGMKPVIWNLAWSYNEPEYRERLKEVMRYDIGVYDDVMKTNPKSWCRAFHKIGNFCEDVENNSTESFNNTIRKAREKPFIPMLETIRRMAMARIAKRSAISHDYPGACTPYVTKFLAAEHKKASQCVITRSTNGDFEAKFKGCSYRVNLPRRTCTCMKFQITGIPCEHAYGVIMVKKLTPEDYVCHWFRTATWKRTYSEGLVPVRGARFWPHTDLPDIYAPPEPEPPTEEPVEQPSEQQSEQLAKKKGKKVTKAEKARKKGVNESPSKKAPKQKKRIMHCGICGVADHNSRFHKKDKQGQGSQAEASQGVLTQGSQAEASQSVGRD